MAKMTPSEAMVESLVAEGVSAVMGIVGSAFMDPLDLFPAAGIRFVPVRHEQAAAHMADGYARSTGRTAVCIGQNGPGVSNMVTSVAAAYHAHSPMVVITPSATTGSVYLDGFQETDQLKMFQGITKYQIRVPRPDRMAETMRTAFRIAQAELGPVQVDVPRDYWYGDCDDDVLDTFQYRTSNRGPGPSAAVDRAAQLLVDAKFPVIVSGYGVVVSNAFSEVSELAESLAAPVVNSYLHNDSFPQDHELAAGPIGYMGSKAGMRLLSEADVVLAIGCRMNVFGTVPQYGLDFFPSSASLIQIDIDPRQIGRTKRIELGIIGDAAETTSQITQRLATKQPIPEDEKAKRRNRIATEKENWAKELRQLSSNDGSPVSPRRALDELASVLPVETIVTTDIGNICSLANGYLQFTKPRKFLAAMNFGNCGFAYPAALGAKLANPEHPAVALVGDGAWAMGLEEVMTAVEEDLPAIGIVFNNRQWGAEKRNQIDFYGERFVGTNIGRDVGGFNFADIAAAMKAESRRVESSDELKDAYVWALGEDAPVVLEIMVDPEELAEPFRRDALQPPRRLLPKYTHLDLTAAG